MLTVSPIFEHYPFFIFAEFRDGSTDLWIASCYGFDPDNPESVGSKIVREDRAACYRYWLQRGYSVDTAVVSKENVEFKRRGK
jgi:hypothetical protein